MRECRKYSLVISIFYSSRLVFYTTADDRFSHIFYTESTLKFNILIFYLIMFSHNTESFQFCVERGIVFCYHFLVHFSDQYKLRSCSDHMSHLMRPVLITVKHRSVTATDFI